MPNPGGDARFHTTRWSLVVAAAGEGTAARAALDTLCEAYWLPVYAFYRRDGLDPEAAADQTQGLFTELLEREDLHHADPTRGRFRSWLLACARNSAHNARNRGAALRRGGGIAPLSLNSDDAESRLSEMIDDAGRGDPSRRFEAAFAHALIGRAVTRIRAEHEADGNLDRFLALRPTLFSDDSALSYSELATQLRTTEGAIKAAAHRLRARFAHALRAEVSEVVDDPSDVEAEIAALRAALAQ